MHIKIDLSINLPRHTLMHLLESLLFLFIRLLHLFIFDSLHIFDLLPPLILLSRYVFIQFIYFLEDLK